MKILNRFNFNVIFEAECETVKDLVLAAVKSGANLICAYLGGEDLGGAYLGGVNLGGVNLGGANLVGANLVGAKGILKDEVKPLQITGSQHFLIVQEIGKIKIGCEHHTVEHWLENFKEIGTKAGYTESQIDEYFKHIKYAEQWMIENGVRDLEEK